MCQELCHGLEIDDVYSGGAILEGRGGELESVRQIQGRSREGRHGSTWGGGWHKASQMRGDGGTVPDLRGGLLAKGEACSLREL